MFKRLFFTAVGLGAGVALGVYVVRKVEETQRRMSPEALAASAGARVDSVGARLRAALEEGRAAAAAKEADLRASYGVGPARRRAAPAETSAAVFDAERVAEWGSTSQPAK